MTDITKALRELPPMPKHPDYVALRSWDRETERANYHVRLCSYLEARLALAERLLQENSQLVTGEWQCAKDARAYLAHRAKEQQT